MLYPILTIACILLRGQLSLQRKENLVLKDDPNVINKSINWCTIEEFSRLLNDKIALNKAIELAAHRHRTTKQLFVNDFINKALNDNHTDNNNNHTNNNKINIKDKQIQIQTQDSESDISQVRNVNQIPDNIRFPTISHKYHPILNTNNNNGYDFGSQISYTLPPTESHSSPKMVNNWSPFEASLHISPFLLPHRNIKPPPGAKVLVEFKGKKREVTISVSPLMTVLEALKQAEIKFERTYKLYLEDGLISFWSSPILSCIIVDRISTIRNTKSMMWQISIIGDNGQIEFQDFCLPAEIFVKPGSTIKLVYISVQN
ncbi:uncharacterized protein LOC128958462 [Oppia nitens]|uniref:uncharacterized protein LOC128958462 n=1 Tax=Oppia nitens TaxID=1686743 RepID=UPI0023DA6D54|nr:uncharacterized protein LOC128958462 [Oppia nitens]